MSEQNATPNGNKSETNATEDLAKNLYPSQSESDEKTPEGEKKPEDKKSEEKKPEDKKSEEKKPEDKGDKKSDDDKKSEDKKDEEKSDDKKSEEKKASEEGEYELEVPEGMKINEAQLDKFKAFAKENEISKEVAQNFVNDFMKEQSEALQAEVMETVNGWGEAAKADKEIGGAKFDENVAIAMEALKKYGGDGLLPALKETGMGSHPEIIRFALRVGKAMKEDNVLTGGGDSPQQDGDLDVMYPSMSKK